MVYLCFINSQKQTEFSLDKVMIKYGYLILSDLSDHNFRIVDTILTRDILNNQTQGNSNLVNVNSMTVINCLIPKGCRLTSELEYVE